MLTISGLPSRGQWDARRATSSPYLFAEPITATTTASETRLPGGSEGLSILSRHRESCGSQPGASHKNDARFEANRRERNYDQRFNEARTKNGCATLYQPAGQFE